MRYRGTHCLPAGQRFASPERLQDGDQPGIATPGYVDSGRHDFDEKVEKRTAFWTPNYRFIVKPKVFG
jgi:hypothetical protein